jgi:hypothetical protein
VNYYEAIGWITAAVILQRTMLLLGILRAQADKLLRRIPVAAGNDGALQTQHRYFGGAFS